MTAQSTTPPGKGGAGEEQTAVLDSTAIVSQADPGSNTLSFLTALFADLPEGVPWFYLWTLPDRQTSWFTDPESAARFAGKCDGRDVYCGIALADRRGEPGQRILADPARDRPDGILAGGIVGLVADVDFAGPGHTSSKRYPPDLDAALALVGALPLAPTFVIHSGGGLHLWWLLREPWTFDANSERKEAQEILHGWGATVQATAARMGFDVDSVHDLARVLRVPGTTNHKDPENLRPVTVLDAASDRRYSHTDFEEFFPEDFDADTSSDSAAAAVEIADLALPDGTEADLEARFDEILSHDSKLTATWARTRTDLHDKSASGYDLALASRLAVKHGWTAAEVAWAVQHSRREHKGDKPLHASKLRRTVQKAMAAAERSQDEAEAKAAALVSDATRGAAREFAWTDLGNAERLIDEHGSELRYCPAWVSWLTWTGQQWRRDEDGAVFRRARDTVRGMYVEAAQIQDDDRRKAFGKFVAKSESERSLGAMVSMGQWQEGVPVKAEDLDADPWKLNCQNGLVDLRTANVLPHDPSALCSKIIPVALAPQAPCPLWLAFLDRIMGGNADLIGFLQRAVGYSLTGSTREQCLFILHGGGANGKSVFLATLHEILADYAQTTDFTTFLTRRGEGPRNDLAALAGARFVTAIEADAGQSLAENVVKVLTGDVDRISARFLHREFFEFTPSFKVWLATNHKPRIRGTDHAIWRRLRLIPFDVTIPEAEQDRDLAEKLKAELPGILAWAVEGCLMYRSEGLGVPDEVSKATAQYRDEEDVLSGFLGDCCSLSPAVTVTAKALRDAYVSWCDGNGEKPLSAKAVGARLRERGCESYPGTGGYSAWRGIGLLSGDRPLPETA